MSRVSVSDLRYASIVTLRGMLDAGSVTATELAQAMLAQLDAVGRPLNAIANLMPDRALDKARRVDRRIAPPGCPPAALRSARWRPVGGQGSLSARGAPTTWGVPRFARRVLDEDAAVVARLERREAVLVAKLSTVEMAGGGRPRLPGASLQGQGQNPWNRARYSVVRPVLGHRCGARPSALRSGHRNGRLGARPRGIHWHHRLSSDAGLIPRTGVMPLSWTLDKIGVLARSAADCATVAAAIAGPDGVDSDATLRFRMPARSLPRIRVGWDDSEPGEVDPVIRGAVEQGLAAVRRLDVEMCHEPLHDDNRDGEALEVVMLAEAAYLHRELFEDPEFELVDDKQLAELRDGLRYTARDYLEAMERARAARIRFRQVFGRVDVLVAASRPSTAPPLAEPRAPRGDATRSDFLRNVGNLIGLPAVSMPCGLADDGLPAGLQFVGPPGSDGLLLALAAEFQGATNFHELRPPEPA